METVENGVESAKIEKYCDDDEKQQIRGKFDNNEQERIFNFESVKHDEYCSDDEYEKESELDKIREMEEEHETLLSSLMALTTHFAQVQFRLHQVIEAPEKERDVLLKKLEDFADRGIPNYNENQKNEIGAKNILTNIDSQKNHQQELIEQLKTQLDDLEKYAYESGEPILPQAVMVEKQKIIIDELKRKMNLNLNELDLPQLSPDELRTHVDVAIGEFVSPLKMKEQLIAQLETQINDLERFVKFLQVEKGEKKRMLKEQFLKKHQKDCTDVDLHNQSCNCNSVESTSSSASTTVAKNHHKFNETHQKQNQQFSSVPQQSPPPSSSSSSQFSSNNQNQQQITFSGKFYQMLNKASTVFQIFALSQMGCASENGSRNFKRNILKKTTRGNHWGDLRAKLEVDIQEILALVIEMNRVAANEELFKEMREKEEQTEDDDVFIEAKAKTLALLKETRYRSTSSSSSAIQPTATTTLTSTNSIETSSKSDELKSLNIELITLVRKRFAVTLQKLIQHGLRSVNETRHLVPFMGCFSTLPLNIGGGTSSGGASDYEDYKEMHAWELILEYYNLRNGDFYTETPAQKLSQSFNLDIVGEGFHSNKQKLLTTIKNIINLHSPYKRSYNSHFKAFVCAGLNSHLLVHWLNLIFQCHDLTAKYYTTWSYVAQTGFRDALKSIDQLTKHEFFDLPVDLAIRNLANIKDVFS